MMPMCLPRRRPALVFLMAWVAAFSAGRASAVPPASATAPRAQPPNVVMIVSDDQGWGDFGFMGHPEIRTPHLDRLAAESAVFPNGYVPTSLCRSSLATIITGQYAHQHAICCNDAPEGVDRSAMMLSSRTVPGMLGERGYASLQTGKWWEGHFSNGGFTDGMTEDGKSGRHGDAGLLIGRQTMEPVFSFIDRLQAKGQPFFVWYAPMMPHTPHNPPPRLLKKYQKPGRDEKIAKYWAMCEWFDETCGALLDHLDEKNLRDNTLVVFVVDNGWIQFTGPNRNPSRAQFETRSKLTPYDGGLRTPIILRWPDRTKPGVYRDLVSTIDLAPTMLAACDVQPGKNLHGLSLLDVAAGGGGLDRDAVFGEIFQHTAVAVGKPGLSLTHRWVREGDWKLIRFDRPQKPPELFDVKADPAEERNLASNHPDRGDRRSQRSDGWWNGRDGDEFDK